MFEGMFTELTYEDANFGTIVPEENGNEQTE